MAPLIDVCVERAMPAAAEVVAAVMFDPRQDPTWMKALTGTELLDTPFATGARVRRHARFLRRDISWITTATRFEPPHLLELSIADGPFTGTVTYEIEAAGEGSVVRIRNVGTPGQFAWMPGFVIRSAMRSSLGKDLANLERAATS